MKAAIAVILAFVLIVPVCLAQPIETFNAEFRVVENKVLVDYYVSNVSEPIVLAVPSDARAVELFLNGERAEVGAEIHVPEGTNTVRLSFITNKYLEKTDKGFFLVDLKVPAQTGFLSAKLVLPEGAFLKEPTNEAVHPEAKSIDTDGQHIIIKWERADVEKDGELLLFVIFMERAGMGWTVPVVVLLLIVLGLGFFGFRHFRRKKEAVFEGHLLESEKKVVELLKEAPNNELKQKRILEATEFSKAKLSRTLRHLQERYVIESIPYGNTNIIKLIKKSKKHPQAKSENLQTE